MINVTTARSSDVQLILKHCQMMLALSLYTIIVSGTSMGLSVASMSEPIIVRAVKVIAELMLGILVFKRLADEFDKEFPNFPLIQLTSQSLTKLIRGNETAS